MCRYDFQSRVQPPPPAFISSTPTVKPVEVRQPAAMDTLTLEAPFMRTRGLIGTIVMGLILLPTLFFQLLRAPSFILLLLIGWMLMVLFIPQVLLLIRPRRLVVQGDRLIAKGWPSLSTPLSNLFLITHDGTGLCLRFQSIGQVDCSPKLRQQMEKDALQHGHHLRFPGFTFVQAEALRQKAGLPEAQPSATLTHVRHYQQTIRQLTPKVFVTYLLVGINCFIYLLMVATGVPALDPTPHELLQWGANFGPYTCNGQAWRLFTCCFLHIGIFHLFFNMWALLSVGPFMERLLGNVGFLILYIVAGLVGSIVSVRWDPLVVSAGASGAIFGIFGAMLGFLVLHRQSMPVTIYRQVWSSGVALLVFNFVFAAGVPGIDVAAHLGGAIAGFAAGMLLSQPLDEHTRRMRVWRNTLLATLAALMIISAYFFLPTPSSAEAQWSLATMEYAAVEDSLIGKYNRMLRRLEKKQASDQEMHDLLTRQILPEWNRWLERFSNIQLQAGPRAKSQQAMLQYMNLQKEGWQLEVEAVEQNDSELMKRAHDKFNAAGKVIERMKQKP